MNRLATYAPIALALALGALVPSTTAAAVRPTTFQLYKGSSCIDGITSSHVEVAIKWRRANGALIVAGSWLAGKNGGFMLCSPESKPLKEGDVVGATVNRTKHRLVIPLLRLKMNTTTDTFYGRAPAASVIDLRADTFDDVPVTVGSDGRWSYSNSGVDIVSGTYGATGGAVAVTSSNSRTLRVEQSEPQHQEAMT